MTEVKPHPETKKRLVFGVTALLGILSQAGMCYQLGYGHGHTDGFNVGHIDGINAHECPKEEGAAIP